MARKDRQVDFKACDWSTATSLAISLVERVSNLSLMESERIEGQNLGQAAIKHR